MTYYAVIDTNVIVSSLMMWDSIPADVLNHVYHKKIVPIVNVDILKEYEEVLKRGKFNFSMNKIYNVITFFKKRGIFIDSVDVITNCVKDPKDVVFYQVTMEIRKKENAYLITGNIKHFPKETFVVTPRQMLDIIENDNCSKIDKL